MGGGEGVRDRSVIPVTPPRANTTVSGRVFFFTFDERCHDRQTVNRPQGREEKREHGDNDDGYDDEYWRGFFLRIN